MSHTGLIFHRIEREGAVAIRGINAIAAARATIEHAITSAGYAIVIDPTSDADLVDAFAITALSGLQIATVGAAVGAFVGLFAGSPAYGALLGARIGLVVGGVRGLQQVNRGWRVRAVRDIDGTPIVTIHSWRSR